MQENPDELLERIMQDAHKAAVTVLDTQESTTSLTPEMKRNLRLAEESLLFIERRYKLFGFITPELRDRFDVAQEQIVAAFRLFPPDVPGTNLPRSNLDVHILQNTFSNAMDRATLLADNVMNHKRGLAPCIMPADPRKGILETWKALNDALTGLKEGHVSKNVCASAEAQTLAIKGIFKLCEEEYGFTLE